MARTPGALNTSTMIKALQDAGRWRADLATQGREAIKAVFDSIHGIDAELARKRKAPEPAKVVPPPPPVIPVAPPKPRELSEREKRDAQRRKEMKDKLEATLRSFGDPKVMVQPIEVDSITEETLIEGKSVGEWARIIEARESAVSDSPGRLLVIDLTDVPHWAMWAVRHWERMERPTVKSKARKRVEELLAKAEEQEKYAALDEQEAKKAESCGDQKTAKAKREQVAKKRAKAAEFRKQAEQIEVG